MSCFSPRLACDPGAPRGTGWQGGGWGGAAQTSTAPCECGPAAQRSTAQHDTQGAQACVRHHSPDEEAALARSCLAACTARAPAAVRKPRECRLGEASCWEVAGSPPHPSPGQQPFRQRAHLPLLLCIGRRVLGAWQIRVHQVVHLVRLHAAAGEGVLQLALETGVQLHRSLLSPADRTTLHVVVTQPGNTRTSGYRICVHRRGQAR